MKLKWGPKKALYGILALLVIAGFVSWRCYPELGIHLFSESIELLIASAVVDRLIEWDREHRLEPARNAALADAQAVAQTSNEFVLALARSSVPSSELSRIEAELSFGPDPWLAEYAGSLVNTSRAPYGAPPPYGQGFLTWQAGVDHQVKLIGDLIGRYMMRHVAHADPRVTEAVHGLEENGLSRILSYGSDLFWMMQAELRASMYKDFIEKLRRLDSVLHSVARDKAEMSRFGWNRLAIEIREHPTTHEHTPWRPS